MPFKLVLTAACLALVVAGCFGDDESPCQGPVRVEIFVPYLDTLSIAVGDTAFVDAGADCAAGDHYYFPARDIHWEILDTSVARLYIESYSGLVHVIGTAPGNTFLVASADGAADTVSLRIIPSALDRAASTPES